MEEDTQVESDANEVMGRSLCNKRRNPGEENEIMKRDEIESVTENQE